MAKYDLSQLKLFIVGERSEAYSESSQTSEMVVISLSQNEIPALRTTCVFRLGERVSNQDVLSGWRVALFERIGLPIKRLISTLNAGSTFMFSPGGLTGKTKLRNLLPTGYPDLTDQRANLSQLRGIPCGTDRSTNPLENHDWIQIASRTRTVASTIRTDLQRIRDLPEDTVDWLLNASSKVEQVA